MKLKLEQQILDNMSEDPNNWRGPFYFNRKDPRLMVPKINPELGWTFNFASPYSYVTLIITVGVAIYVSFFS